MVGTGQKAENVGRNLDPSICDSLQELAGDISAEQRIAELRSLSGTGDSDNWHFDRSELYKRL
ncbi:hypothetical protein [Paracidobacterium acidisoli]|uniref:Uncharacterized protein n=1 Tax=Paracidobacterium acidisoli TaxID=2303751 RepID=A0A372IL86_9BACT|nr:hypothetical protein [Paracidobacterium acidisoli]MBT9332902.1 hypothetical protein [Paracidobacterium acidisoli]